MHLIKITVTTIMVSAANSRIYCITVILPECCEWEIRVCLFLSFVKITLNCRYYWHGSRNETATWRFVPAY